MLLLIISFFLNVNSQQAKMAHIHHELLAELIAKRVTNSATTKDEKLTALQTWIHYRMFKPGDEPFQLASHPMGDLKNGIGDCGQQAQVMLHLAAKVGIKGKLIHLEGAGRSHAFCAFEIDLSLIHI